MSDLYWLTDEQMERGCDRSFPRATASRLLMTDEC
jgi:hypothetical protein